jgi:Holliday junction resolvase RusA-like endonuclease
MIEFFVDGKPVPQGSLVFMKGKPIHAGADRLATWRADIARLGKMAGCQPSERPIAISLIFNMLKPKTVDRKMPTVPPDLDKLIRAVLDGLTGVNEDETTGIQIVRRALEEPLRQIIANAGGEGSIVVQKVLEGKDDFGYNARTDVYENLIAAGVIDPAKVTRVALENAASIAGMFLTTECVIADKKEENAAPMMPPMGGGMGGMM